MVQQLEKALTSSAEITSGDPLLDRTARMFAGIVGVNFSRTHKLHHSLDTVGAAINGRAAAAPQEGNLLLRYGLIDHEDSMLDDPESSLISSPLVEFLRIADEIRVIEAHNQIFLNRKSIKDLEAEVVQIEAARKDSVFTVYKRHSRQIQSEEQKDDNPDPEAVLLEKLLSASNGNQMQPDGPSPISLGSTNYSPDILDEVAAEVSAISSSGIAEIAGIDNQIDILQQEKSLLTTTLGSLLDINRRLKTSEGREYYILCRQKRELLDTIPAFTQESREFFQLTSLIAFFQGVLDQKFTPKDIARHRSLDLKKTGENMLLQVHGNNSKGIKDLLEKMETVILENPAANQNLLNLFHRSLTETMRQMAKFQAANDGEIIKTAENGRPILYYLISVLENNGTYNRPDWQKKSWLVPKEYIVQGSVKRGLLIKTSADMETEELPNKGHIFALTINWGGMSLSADNSPTGEKGNIYWGDFTTVTSADLEAMHNWVTRWQLEKARQEVRDSLAKNGNNQSSSEKPVDFSVSKVITFQEFETLYNRMHGNFH
ncbi:MAG: hypothetical protein UV73_C0008G0021 [Candidatus Gottesmanbacteria bacterium GW2011_GWA2_43_14]|uniref:Uncharacterized protein n=1 Tax=Candidatus Gottesmanbacteria bacterium GW2011_GWA2_43_14 TaxID=1618443 RepID=A0A0G1FR41_9BACT|nr:MAG: hypothetical protein UV73_C0008G0021 [Candidatus Gottesmanbacteria bacterium GW2011_GWA2_43_14]